MVVVIFWAKQLPLPAENRMIPVLSPPQSLIAVRAMADPLSSSEVVRSGIRLSTVSPFKARETRGRVIPGEMRIMELA